MASVESKLTAWLTGARIGVAVSTMTNKVRNRNCDQVPPWAHQQKSYLIIVFL